MVSCVKVMTGEVRKVRPQIVPKIDAVLRARLAGVNILAQQLFRAQVLIPARREYLYWNYRIANVSHEPAMSEIAGAVIEAGISSVFQL